MAKEALEQAQQMQGALRFRYPFSPSTAILDSVLSRKLVQKILTKAAVAYCLQIIR